MSTVAPRPPAPPINPALLDSEGYIDEHIHRTRRALKLVDFSAGVITLAVGLLAFLLIAGLIDHWIVPGGLGTAGRMTLFGLLLAGVCWYGWRQFVPLLRSINPVYAAHTIEKASPSLKNSLLNLLLFRGHRREMSAKVYHALEQQAAQRLSTASVDGAIDRSALLRLGYALVVVVAACALYAILSPKNLALSAGRVLAPWADIAPPSRVQILNIEPGDASVARGERIAISAEVLAVRDNETVRLRYSTDDEQQVDETITMTRPPGEARFAADLPRAADSGRAAGVMNDLEYWIEAGDARSPRFRLTVFDRPTIVVQRVHYQAPAYTGEPSRTVDNVGDIRAIEGTIVAIEALANQPIRSAYVDFDADGSNDLKMTVDDVRATASFELKLRPDRRTPLHTSYTLRYTTTDGRTNADPAQYRIEVTPDYAPEVRITRPEEAEHSARVDETVLIGVEARDPDYAISQVRLVGRVGENDVTLAELPPENGSGLFKGTKMFTPGDAGVKPGDVLEYWAEARDNRRPEANIALSEHRRLRIVAPDDAAQEQTQNNQRGGADQPPPDQGQNGDEGQAGAQGAAGEQGENQDAKGQAGEDQGEGGAGGAGGQGEPQEGESPEAGESASAGGQGGNKGGEPNAEQNAAGGQGGADGEQSEGSEQGEQLEGGAAGEQSAGGGNQQTGRQQGVEQQASQNGADQQPGESASADGSAESASNGGASSGSQERVSPDGDDDPTAFERIQEFMQNQDAANRSEGGESGEGAESEGAEQAEANQQQGSADNQQEQPGAGDRQQQGAASDRQQQGAAGDQPQNPNAGQSQGGATPDRAGAADREQQGEQAQNPSAGQLADGKPGEGQAPTKGDDGQQTQGASAESGATGENGANQQSQGETPAGADGALNQNNGKSPAGDEAAGQPGAPEASNKRDREGTSERDDGESGGEAEPATADSRGNTESDAQGDQSGDRAGVGQRGGGQQAENAGQGEAGSHTASDTGMGQSADQGAGETGSQGGQQQLADGETGESSGDQAGAGSETGDAEGEQQQRPGGEQSGDPSAGEQQDSAGGQQGDAESEHSKQPGSESTDPAAGEPQPGEGAAASGQRGEQPSPADQSAMPSDAPGNQAASGSSGSQTGEQSPSDPADASESQSAGGSPGSSSSPPNRGGFSGGGFDGTSTGTDPGGDDANLLYARKQTDLVLNRLDEQLAKQKVDPELLKRLGWNEDELRRFVARWKDLKARAEGETPDPDAKQELNRALNALGLRQDGPQRIRAAAEADQIRDLNDAYRTRPPLEYMDRVRWYMKGASASDEQGE